MMWRMPAIDVIKLIRQDMVRGSKDLWIACQNPSDITKSNRTMHGRFYVGRKCNHL